MKIAFLDRDGTVISDYPDEEWRYINKPEFLDKSIDAIRKIRDLGYEIIFISNQYLINQNIITDQQFQRVNKLFLEELANQGIEVLDFFYCPHTDEDNCNCKKPRPGMIEESLKKYPNIDLESSFYAGDSIVDVEIARYFGLKMFYLNDKSNGIEDSKVKVVNDLYEITNFI